MNVEGVLWLLVSALAAPSIATANRNLRRHIHPLGPIAGAVRERDILQVVEKID